MTKEKIIDDVQQIFRDVLDNDSITIHEHTNSGDIDEWDSLSHVQLIVAIEKHFKLKFSAAEVMNWKDVAEMTETILKKMNGASQEKPKTKESTEVAATTATVIPDEQLPSYKRNYIGSFPNIQHGKNCFIAEGATLSKVIMGDQVWINKFATVYSSYEPIRIGSDCYIGPHTWIEGHAGLEIGDSVHIAGPGTCIYTHSGMKMALNHEHLGNPGYKPKLEKSHDFRVPIRIGNNVWIGPNCSISPGVIIQDFVVVMPNTLVKSGIIESYSLVHGDGVIEKNSEFVRSLIEKKK